MKQQVTINEFVAMFIDKMRRIGYAEESIYRHGKRRNRILFPTSWRRFHFPIICREVLAQLRTNSVQSDISSSQKRTSSQIETKFLYSVKYDLYSFDAFLPISCFKILIKNFLDENADPACLSSFNVSFDIISFGRLPYFLKIVIHNIRI